MSNYLDSRYYPDSRTYNEGKVELGTTNYGFQNSGGYHARNIQHTSPQTDPVIVRTAIDKLKMYSIVAMILAFLTIVAGATTLGVAAKNIGFPVFNFGPLLVGIIYFLCGSVGYNACKKALLTDSLPERISYAKCGIVAVFAMCVTLLSLSILSAVFAFISGAVCAGADIDVYRRDGNVRTKIDVKQYCSPNDTANTVLAFVDGGLCILICIWCIYGTTFFCCYGRHFGIKSRRRGF